MAPNTDLLIRKINMLCYMKKMTTITMIKRGAEDRCSSELEKAHFTGEFVIVAEVDDHVLCRLASSLLNVVRQENWLTTKIFSLGDMFRF